MARLLLLVLLGCGSGTSEQDAGPPSREEDSSAGDTDSGQPGTDAGPPTGEVVGQIDVVDHGGLANQSYAQSRLFGWFAEPLEPLYWWHETRAEGDCQLFEYELGLCSGDCAGLCVAPDECRPWPSYLDAGPITVSGLRAPYTLERMDTVGVYSDFGGLPTPLFDPGSRVGLEAPGAAVPAFDVAAIAPRPLRLDEIEPTGPVGVDAEVVALENGADAILRWSDPEPGTIIRLRLTEGGSAHGTPSPTLLLCETEDTGEIRIPRAMVEALPDLGSAPKGRDPSWLAVARFRTAETTVDGDRVVLNVGSGTDYGVFRE